MELDVLLNPESHLCTKFYISFPFSLQKMKESFEYHIAFCCKT